MCETLKREFYAACPIWHWPVLWWQFAIMERSLAELYAAGGRARMVYGLALYAGGRLRLVFVSDAPHKAFECGALPSHSCFLNDMQRQTPPSSDYSRSEISNTQDYKPPRATLLHTPLFLDPG